MAVPSQMVQAGQGELSCRAQPAARSLPLHPQRCSSRDSPEPKQAKLDPGQQKVPPPDSVPHLASPSTSITLAGPPQQHHHPIPPAPGCYPACVPIPTRAMYAPVALVPDPGVPASLGAEVGTTVVVDLGGEAEQATVPVGPVRQAGRAGEAVLLGGAVQHVQRPVLYVRRLLHQRGVQQ